MDRYCNEKLRKYRDGSLYPVQAVPRSSTWTSEALGPGRPAIAYMAAKASEHLTADPARSSREPVTQRPRSPPTSDPRGPEQREPNRLLTDINWAPRGLQ